VNADLPPPWVHGEQGERSAQVIQIENGRAVLAVTLCGIVAALGVGFSAFAIYTAQQAAMEARLAQEKLNELKPRVAQLERDHAHP